jgi:hypothetical protein
MALVLAALALTFGACRNTTGSDGADEASAVYEPAPGLYANDNNWLAYSAARGNTADVFFIYPTVISDGDVISDEAGYCDINNKNMHNLCGALFSAYGDMFQQCNIFAPYYHQYSVGYLTKIAAQALLSPGHSPKVLEDAIAAVPLKDCIAAFEYYLKHYDRGYPIIFVSHSQGTIIMKQLLLWIKDNYPAILANRTIAAYMLGFAITDDYLANFKDLHFVTGKSDIHCIITYNTESPAAQKAGVPSLFCNNQFYPNCKVVNPITWTTDTNHVPATESLGSLVEAGSADGYNAGFYPGFADAQIDQQRGTVITNAPITPDLNWPTGCLHHYDFALFYGDIQANVAVRIAAWYNAAANNWR